MNLLEILLNFVIPSDAEQSRGIFFTMFFAF